MASLFVKVNKSHREVNVPNTVLTITFDLNVNTSHIRNAKSIASLATHSHYILKM